MTYKVPGGGMVGPLGGLTLTFVPASGLVGQDHITAAGEENQPPPTKKTKA